MDGIETFFTETVIDFDDLALLLVRWVVALIFITSFYNKIQDVKGFAKGSGIPIAAGYFLVFAELAGGLGLLFGVLTQAAALGLMLIMVSTMYFHIVRWKSPYWSAKGGWEYDLMIFAMMAVILTVGGGDISIKALPSNDWMPFLD